MTLRQALLACVALVVALLALAVREAHAGEMLIRFQHPPEASELEPSPYPTTRLAICVEGVFCTQVEAVCDLGEVCEATVELPDVAMVALGVAEDEDGEWSGLSNALRVYHAPGAMDANGDGHVTTLDWGAFYRAWRGE